MTPEQETELFERAPAFVDLLPAYPDATVAFENYANYIAAKHCDARPGTACAGCGGFQPGTVVRVAWRGDFDTRRSRLKTLVMLPLLALGHVSAHSETIRFHSEHRLCPSCRRDLWLRRQGSEVVRHATFVLALLCGTAMAITFFLTLMPLLMARPWEWLPFGGLVLSLVAFILTYRFSRRANALFLPPLLTPIAKKFFVIESVRQPR